MNIKVLLFVLSPLMVVSAQLPPSPRAIVETDIKDNSIRMRSMELERVKREADKPIVDPTRIESRNDFSRIKADFENLQKTQDAIIKAFTGVKLVDYAKVASSAKVMTKLAKRLNLHLFGEGKGRFAPQDDPPKAEQNATRSLILELESAVGRFVNNATFQNPKVIETIVSEHAQTDLLEIIRLSQALSAASRKFN